MVYGGWGDNGRDQQAYTVYYSTVTSPANFLPLAIVNFNPAISNNLQSATRVSITYSAGVLASNVAALKFDFTSPGSENGYCGYSEITVFGNASAPLVVMPTLITNTQPATATTVIGDQISFSADFASAQPMDYQWQVIAGGATNNIPGATNPKLVLIDLQLTNTASYRLMASNALGIAVSSASSLVVSSLPTPVNSIIASVSTQTGLGSGTFTPVWSVATNNSLIAGQMPGSSSGNFSMEISGRNVDSLTAGGDNSLTRIDTSVGYTTSTNYVTCGNGNGAGSTMVYALTGSATGYNLTNIVVYGGWADAGRDQQAYTVACSSITAPSNFIPLTSVNFNPSNPANAQSATRVTLSSSLGVLATNVAAVKFDFTTPTSENGFCGYSEISLYGRPSLTSAQTALGGTLLLGGEDFMLDVSNLSIGQSYQLQSTTNLSTSIWAVETNFVATHADTTLSYSIANCPQKFYRVVAY